MRRLISLLTHSTGLVLCSFAGRVSSTLDDGLLDGLVGRGIERRRTARALNEGEVDIPIARIVIGANPEAALVPALSARSLRRLAPPGSLAGERRRAPHGLALEFLDPVVDACQPHLQFGNATRLPFRQVNQVRFGEGFELGSIHPNLGSRY